jgi:hypothetical protein
MNQLLGQFVAFGMRNLRDRPFYWRPERRLPVIPYWQVSSGPELFSNKSAEGEILGQFLPV